VDQLGRAIVERAVLRGTFRLRSGATSDYYIDKYRFGTDPVLLRAIADRMAALVPAGTQRIAGTVLGAVPLAVAVSLATGIPTVLVRPEEKAYGTGKRVEGELAPGDRVTVVEDVVTTGGAALAAVAALRDAGAEPLVVLAVVDREEGGGEAFRAAGVPLQALFTVSGLDLRAPS
jgi:orotate phosphoribosyltransferase